MACIYILYSKTNNMFYTGSSRENNSQKRLHSHNSGKTRSTKSGRPWIVIIEEKYDTFYEARKRELYLKSGVGRSWIKEKVGDYKM